MYIDNSNHKAKIGIVSVDIKKGSVRIRFTYPKSKRNEFNVGKFSELRWQSAIKTAQIIDRDIAIGDFDTSLVRYRPELAKSLEVAKIVKPLNLLDLWETYKNLSEDRVAPTTIKRSWIPWEKNYLGKTPAKLLEIDKASEFIAHLLTRYSPGSLDSFFSNCLMPSVNLAVKTGKLERNPYAAIPLAKKSKKQIEAYEPEEVKLIVQAFYDDKYLKKSSRYLHSFYAPMIQPL